ncbi:MAG TPA: hypothetical protein VKQ32_22735 [Polyangia bacterium]|nr:hypothetical protein [Polyangia bacterium]
MTRNPRSSYVTPLYATAALLITGCGLFIHSTPISKLPEQDRETVAQSGGTPRAVRLTKPAKVSGFDVAAGSVVQEDGQDFQLQTAEALTIKGVIIPAGSWFELKKANSIITGDVYNWNGVVHLGGPQEYGIIQAQQGDRAFFTGNLFSNMQLTQISISTPREIGGRTLPRGSIIDLRENGQIQETFTPGEQQQLAHDREERRKERERHDQRCKEVCAPVTDFAENAKCMANCRS